MAKPNPQVAAHLEWLGFVKPTGLVVSPTALVRAGAILNRRDAEGQNRLRACIGGNGSGTSDPLLPSFRDFARTVLDWSFSPKGYAGTDDSPLPSELEVAVPDSAETARPSYAVRKGANESEWQLLVVACDSEGDFECANGAWPSPHATMERLLRHTGVPAGLLFNGHTLRLVSAPKGESSGWLDFCVTDMVETAGRPICSAMRLLLRETRLLSVSKDKRLAALMEDSRKFQNEVSQELSEQVLHALYELLRGFQSAHDASSGKKLLGRFLDPDHPRDDRGDPHEVYRGLLILVLRLIFLLYAEERDMLPQDEVFLGAYSVAGLHRRLREDAALHPDTMDQRYGAYAQLLFLFRMIHDGARSCSMTLPARHGVLFDPDRYRFLEGRTAQVAGGHQLDERIDPPLVSDGTIYRVLEKLLVLKGERISYRALDVEHIGSVYETMMGFRMETAKGRSVAIKAAKKHGAPATIDLDELLVESPGKRAKWIRDRTDRTITARVSKAVREADTIEALHAAVGPIVDAAATPDLVAPGAMVLQPSEERRRSGSHYTPRKLTKPIVSGALRPVLDRLCDEPGGALTPEQLLDLKVCDPAMGSGAFLVEACRQLGAALVKSWRAHERVPDLLDNEDELLAARREVARRCLYGVDRNPVAVDLAKMSLWLATLAKDLRLTFLDHALRHGDSLVGLTQRQIADFHWKANTPIFEPGLEAIRAREQLDRAKELRSRIREAGEGILDQKLQYMLNKAEAATDAARRTGDLVLVAFFCRAKPKEREAIRAELADKVAEGNVGEYTSYLEELREADPPLAPFHWEIEFPGAFDRRNPGFDAIVGNPPFAGKNSVTASNVDHYPLWLKQAHEKSHGNADLVAHFFRRSFDLIRCNGTLGLIATNTIAQGDTRSTGLRWICQHGGEIYQATTRVKWPGMAAVVVSVVHVANGRHRGPKMLNGRAVDQITAFLFHRGGHEDPARLKANAKKSFVGSYVLGMGFTFDDTDSKSVATPLAEMCRLIEENPRNRRVIFPYIGGQEVNTSPTHAHHRHVINFRNWPLRRDDIGETWNVAHALRRKALRREPIVPEDYPDPVAADWPDPLAIVEDKVKPGRAHLTRNSIGRKRARFWWQYGSLATQLYTHTAQTHRVLAINCGATPHHAFTFLPARMIFAHSLAVFPLDTYAAFCALQCRIHEVWARFFGSSLKDDLRYTPSDVFETFPFPANWETAPGLEAAGKEYYEFRADLMVRNDEGLTKTYNRFHDPNEYDLEITRLRELHAAMDRAVLDAYSWDDVPTGCGFRLDHEIDEEEWGRKKKPYRYRWSNEVRDEILARLLELHATRRGATSDHGETGCKPFTHQTERTIRR